MAEIKDTRFQIIDHPLVQHKLHILRDKNTSTKQFRELVTELAIFEGYEAMRDFPLEDVEVETPLEKTVCKRIAGKKVAIIPILRAGLGMVDGILDLVPSARVGHVGMYRDPETHEPHQYYCKFPPDVDKRTCLIVDPMLATGGSMTAAIKFLRDAGVKDIRAPHARLCSRRRARCPRLRPGCAPLHLRARPRAQQGCLHPAGLGRCGRPHLRHEVIPFLPGCLLFSNASQKCVETAVQNPVSLDGWTFSVGTNIV